MASDDVIELGSSDEEPEPAPKKRKHPPNVMVQFPSKLSDITFRPVKTTAVKKKNNAGNNHNVIVNPYASKLINKTKINGCPNQITKSLHVTSSNQQKNVAVNPISLINNIKSSQLKIQKVSSLRPNVIKLPIKINQNPMIASSNLRITKPQGQKCLNKLPPGITVTRTNTAISKRKKPSSSIPQAEVRKKQKLNTQKHSQIGDVLTLELDDDDDNNKPSTASPQWYMRPEQTEMEKKNNTEPKTLVEITIEDSPIKPTSKLANDIEKESISIEDSPFKPSTDNKKTSSEKNQSNDAIPNSKKKLVYPKTSELVDKSQSSEIYQNIAGSSEVLADVIEIEIEPIDTELSQNVENIIDSKQHEESSITDETKSLKSKDVLSSKPKPIENLIIEIEESPAKVHVSEKSPIKQIPQSQLSSISETPAKIETQTKDSEFHPTYQSFIDLCLKLDKSDDMKMIVDKKVRTYYQQVPKDYRESEEFLEMISSKILSIKAAPDKLFLFIKDIVDELSLQKKVAKSQVLNMDQHKESSEYGEESAQDTKRKRQIRKLEKTLKKLHRAIQKLEEQEVDFDDDGDSVYILTDSEDDTDSSSTNQKKINKPIENDRNALILRYKERLVSVHAKLCQLTNTKMPSEPRVRVEANPGQPSGPAKRLEKWINRRVPAGTPLPFPDFHDVLRCVREANEEDNLGWNEAEIMTEARDLFTRCGRKLQRRRQENEWRIAASRLAEAVDPAETSEELKKKLENNRRTAAQKEVEVINKYADRQKHLKLEAVEIGDKEAEESPVESGDDAQEEVADDETSLENKEERKRRLKRLLKEKLKHGSQDEKECISDDGEEKRVTENNKTDTVKEKVKENVSDKKDEKNAEDSTVVISNLNNDDSQEAAAIDLEKTVVEGLHNNELELEICRITDSKENKIDDLNTTIESVNLSSDDNNKIDSDMDELHLLQKLHSSADMASSTLESSDNDTPIAISDSLGSSDNITEGNKQAGDVVSIENSTNSESERIYNDIEFENENQDSEVTLCPKQPELNSENISDDIQGYSASNPKRNSNDEYTEPLENILLASSEEDSNSMVEPLKTGKINSDSYVNLKDDFLSIGETVVEGSMEKNEGASKTIENNDHLNFTDESSKIDAAEGNLISGTPNTNIENALDKNVYDELYSAVETVTEDVTVSELEKLLESDKMDTVENELSRQIPQT